MFEAFSNFVNYFKDIISAIFAFVQSLITGLIQVFKAIPSAIQMLTQSIGYLPSTLAVFATLTITISVIYLVIGRDTGG